MILAAAVLLVVLVFAVREERQRSAFETAHEAWRQERRELLERIQRPELVPVALPRDFRVPDPEPDDMELVGTITYDDVEG